MDTTNNNNQTGLVIKRQVQLESISKAIYLVTDVFENDEPLKLSLRRIAINILENSNKDIVKDGISKLISLINIAKGLSLISNNNAEILIKVLNEYLVQNINIEKNNINESVDIDNMFETDNVINDHDLIDVNNDVNDHIKVKGDIDVYSDFKNKETVIKNSNSNTDIKDKGVSSITIHNNTQNIKTINNISMDIGTRRRRILEIVKSKGSATINEFIESIKGCSSKTIQRELTSLVLSGTLKKTGERRWSKYSMK